MHNEQDLRIATRAIHGGQSPEPVTGAVMPPISLASTYAQVSPGEHKGFEYSRSHNPTRYAFERCIASLEGSGISEDEDASHGGFAFSSGLATTATILDLLDHGDHIVAMDDQYGGTHRLFTQVRMRSAGIDFTFADLSVPGELERAVTDRTKLIWLESPTNPLLKVSDLASVAAFAKSRDIITVCDNTFATPILQRPLEHGIDIVMHSITKYIGGHSDVVGGVCVTNRLDLAERIRFLQNAVGAVMGPFDAYMALRGVKTLDLRVRRHSESGMTIARHLMSHPKVDRVLYPPLSDHPNHDIASRQMQIDGAPAGGGMITAFLAGGLDESRRFLENISIFALAESLGGVESLIDHPTIMTHASVPPADRAKLGITDNLVRFSVGVEDVNDLIADIDQALDAV